MESYIGNNSCRIDKAPIKNYDMYILRFDDTTPFSSPQEVFLKQKQYIIDINPIQIGFPKKNHCSKAESQHHILFFVGWIGVYFATTGPSLKAVNLRFIFEAKLIHYYDILLMVQKSHSQPPFGCFWNP